MSNDGDFLKVLYTSRDAGGREIWLVRYDDGRWGIAVEGKCFATGWPDGQLLPAARAYGEMAVIIRDHRGRGATPD